MYSCLQRSERFSCRDECTCTSNGLRTSVEGSLFIKVYDKLYRLNIKIVDDFNLLCKKFMQSVCYGKLDMLKYNNI